MIYRDINQIERIDQDHTGYESNIIGVSPYGNITPNRPEDKIR